MAVDRGAFAAELDELVARRGVSLAWVCARLADRGNPVSVATLSYWRSGQRHPERRTSLDAVDALEQVLGVEAGRLRRLVAPSRRTGPDVATPFGAEVGQADGWAQVLRDLRDGRPDTLVATSGSVTADVGLDRVIHRVEIRTVWRARVAGARTVLVHAYVDDPRAERPRAVALAGCTLGRTAFDPGSGHQVAELVLDRELEAGETTMTEHAFVGAFDRSPVDNLTRVLERRAPEASVWVRFTAPEVPVAYEAYSRVGDRETTRTSTPVGGSAHHVVHDFGPGVVGVRWTWD